MEGAALDAGGGPDGVRSLGKAPGAIRNEHGRRGHPHHESRPSLRAFALREIPGKYMVLGAGDEDDGIPLEPDPIEEHDIRDLTGIGRYGPDSPDP